MEFPEPVISVAIEPKSKASQDKMMNALTKLARKIRLSGQSPTRIPVRPLSPAWAELHLDIIVDRLFREFKVEANVGQPQGCLQGNHSQGAQRPRSKFIRQSGGRGQYGHCVLEIEPMEPGTGYEFVNKIVGGAIPKEYVAPIDAGIRKPWETVCSAVIRWLERSGNGCRRFIP